VVADGVQFVLDVQGLALIEEALNSDLRIIRARNII
jgi:hypothetical protein